MTVTFTQLKFSLGAQYDTLEEVFRVLREINAAGSGSIINSEVQIHVTGSNADAVIGHLKELEDLGVLSNYKHNELVNQIESFKRAYLK